MDDARRQVLLAEYEEARAERDKLSAYVEVLAVRLGLGDEVEQAGTPGPALPTGQDPVALVFEGELVGKSLPKAVAEVLRRYSPEPHKRPIKTPVLVEALQKGGLDVKTPRQLYRSLYNAAALQQIKGGQWGFATWYPELAKSKSEKTVGPELLADPPGAGVEAASATSAEETVIAEGGAS